MKNMNGKDYLSMGEMSDLLCISYTTLDNWIRRGIISPAFINPSGRKFFTQEQVDAYYRGEYSKK